LLENLTAAGGFLLGRRTYEGFAAHWPNASEEEEGSTLLSPVGPPGDTAARETNVVQWASGRGGCLRVDDEDAGWLED
jgi:hypothetical protein